MSSALYTPAVLRLAMETAAWPRLADPAGVAEKRAPLCGSRIWVDLALDTQGSVEAIGMQVNACALGQASAALLARSVCGKTLSELESAVKELARWLGGDDGAQPDWPDIDVLDAARAHPARHGAILIPFDAAATAMRAALAETGAPA